MSTEAKIDGNRLAMDARLIALGRRMHRFDERCCNEDISERRIDSAERRYMAEAAAILEGTGFRAYHQSDPRGCALYIYDPARAIEWAKRHIEDTRDGAADREWRGFGKPSPEDLKRQREGYKRNLERLEAMSEDQLIAMAVDCNYNSIGHCVPLSIGRRR